MLLEIGTCAGIENYSRHLTGRRPGERPACLLDYFPPDFLVVVDESHVSLPQIGGMFNGDRARKQTLVEYGFRLPSALDNRPLRFDEFMALVPRDDRRLGHARASTSSGSPGGVVVEQIIRPTGLVDPEVDIRPVRGQVDDLLGEIRERAARRERVLVTTLTKRMAEDLTDYLQQAGVRVRYLHSDIDAIERMEILRGLRLGDFDVLVGINLLREGLDLPGGVPGGHSRRRPGGLPPLRPLADPDRRTGRAARERRAPSSTPTGSPARCERALDEMDRRRQHPAGLQPDARDHAHLDREVARGGPAHHPRGRRPQRAARAQGRSPASATFAIPPSGRPPSQPLERQMKEAAANLEFELAALLRDQINELRAIEAPDVRREPAPRRARRRA